MEILNILLKTCIGYITLILLMRFMGKREIGQLNLFDLVILLTIVDLLVVGIEHFDENFFIWLAPITLLGIIQKLLAKLLLKVSFFRNIIDGKESIIVNNGKLILENMKKNNYNINDLFVQLRLKDIRNIDEVEYAILETNGELSVYKKGDSDGSFPLPILTSGSIDKDVLIAIGKDKTWFINKLNEKGYTNYKKIKLVTYKNNDIVIFDDYK